MSKSRFTLDQLVALADKRNATRVALNAINQAMQPMHTITRGMPKTPVKAKVTALGMAGFCQFIVHGEPIGKPRMTQRDKWAKRDCVLRYRSWADSARNSAPSNLPKSPKCVNWTAYLSMPSSWSQKKKTAMRGQLHQSKPDRDNIDKGILDALWESDSCIATGIIEKRWDDGLGARVEITAY